MTYWLVITLVPSPISSQITQTLFDIISLGVDAVLCHDQDTAVVKLYGSMYKCHQMYQCMPEEYLDCHCTCTAATVLELDNRKQ